MSSPLPPRPAETSAVPVNDAEPTRIEPPAPPPLGPEKSQHMFVCEPPHSTPAASPSPAMPAALSVPVTLTAPPAVMNTMPPPVPPKPPRGFE
jgi:hypothetical protein